MSQRLVLVVDDDDDVREITCLALETVGGCEVLGASSGAAGLEQAVSALPNLILLDVMMPGMDGIETAKALWDDERTRGIPVLLLSAKVQVTETWSEVPGVVGAVIKPFDPFGLVAEVNRILDAGDTCLTR